MLGFMMVAIAIGIVSGALLLGPVFRSDLTRAVRGPGRDVVARTSVVVPARNEAERLPALLTSLGLQTAAPLEIIVVNDQSEDETAEVARSHGVRVVDAPDRPAAWLGKPWASHVGALAARGDYLLFLDADVMLHPDALETLAGVLAGGPHDAPDERVVSVQPYHWTLHAYERLALFFNIQVFAGAARRGRGMRLQLDGSCCFGPCILCGREAYERVGGHASVANCVLEDIELGRRFQEAGIQVRGYAGRGVIEFRMYSEGLRSLLDGFTKNLLLGARRANAWFFFLDVFWVSALTAAPAFVAIAAAAGLWPELAVAGGLYAVMAAQVFVAGRRLGHFGPVSGLVYPAALLVFLIVVGRVAILAVAGREVSWKGRPVSPSAGT